MVKCNNCGQTNDEIDTPRLCPGCGHIMMPVIKTEKKKKQSEAKYGNTQRY